MHHSPNSVLDNLCYAEFLAYYVLDAKKHVEVENDCRPEVLLDDYENSNPLCSYPKSVPLMSSKEKLKRRNVKRVVRYHTPNPVSNAEAYAHHLMMLFLPFRQESDLLCQTSNCYVAKLNNPEILSIVNENKLKFEPWSNMGDQVLMNGNFTPRTDGFAQQENDNVEQELEYEESENEDKTVPSHENRPQANPTPSTIDLMPDIGINKLIRSLNEKQHHVFDMITQLSRKYVKNLSAEQTVDNPPLNLFITGGAGTGKSHLIKTLSASVSKTLAYGSSCIEKPNVLLIAPTGVAAVNINGTNIHSALEIPVDARGLNIPKLSDKR